jgi:hypothetical protein
VLTGRQKRLCSGGIRFYRYHFNNNNNNCWGVKCIQIGELGRRRRRGEDNIKMDVTEICCVNLEHVSLRIDLLVDFLLTWL